jgi:hypothetical protein
MAVAQSVGSAAEILRDLLGPMLEFIAGPEGAALAEHQTLVDLVASEGTFEPCPRFGGSSRIERLQGRRLAVRSRANIGSLHRTDCVNRHGGSGLILPVP